MRCITLERPATCRLFDACGQLISYTRQQTGWCGVGSCSFRQGHDGDIWFECWVYDVLRFRARRPLGWSFDLQRGPMHWPAWPGFCVLTRRSC